MYLRRGNRIHRRHRCGRRQSFSWPSPTETGFGRSRRFVRRFEHGRERAPAFCQSVGGEAQVRMYLGDKGTGSVRAGWQRDALSSHVSVSQMTTATRFSDLHKFYERVNHGVLVRKGHGYRVRPSCARCCLCIMRRAKSIGFVRCSFAGIQRSKNSTGRL